MDGQSRNLAALLNASNEYEIPAYQRDYQWTPERWQALVSDVVAAITAPDGSPKHWMGIFLISQLDDVVFPGGFDATRYRVIDGQQRLVTLTLWLAALAHHSRDFDPDSEVINLGNMAKVHVQESDKHAYDVAISGRWRDPAIFQSLSEHQILKAYTYFRYLLWLGQDALASEEPVKIKHFKVPNNEKSFESQWAEFLDTKRGKEVPRGSKADTLALALSTRRDLELFTLVHKPAVDESQAVIFDTLNGMRQELEPLDHVRNSLFVRIHNVEASSIYQDFWYPAETLLRVVRQKRTGAAKAFIYDFVISQGESKRQGSIKAAKGAVHFAAMTSGMRDEALSSYLKSNLVPAMLAWPVVVRSSDSLTYAGNTVRFSPNVLRRLSSIRDLNEGPTNPLVLNFVTDFALGKITEPTLIQALTLIEAFVVRQILGDRAMSPLRARIIDICGQLDKSTSYPDLEKALTSSDWVDDSTIRALAHSKSYAELPPRAIGAILRGIEAQLSGPGYNHFEIGIEDASYSIEHIYPQKNAQWLTDLASWGQQASDMDSVRETIGNLTAVTQAHNKTVGNKEFAKKRAHPAHEGAAAPLRINEDWLDPGITSWTKNAIEFRSKKLIEAAIKRWPTPLL